MHVQIVFNDNNDTISYLPGVDTITYRNNDIQNEGNMILVYSFTDYYKTIEENSAHDIKTFKNFVTSIYEDMTTKQFINWCLSTGKEETLNYKQ